MTSSRIENSAPCAEHASDYYYESKDSPYPYVHKNKCSTCYEDRGYESGEDRYYSDTKIPADALSFTLALGLAKRPGIAFREEGLTFGHRTIPAEETIVKLRKDIPEHRLLNYDKKVLEFKTYPEKGITVNGRRNEDHESEEYYTGASQYPTYADLGYGPVVSKKEYIFNSRPYDTYDVRQHKPKHWNTGERPWWGDDESEDEYYSGEREYGVDTYPYIRADKGLYPCDDFQEKLCYYK